MSSNPSIFMRGHFMKMKTYCVLSFVLLSNANAETTESRVFSGLPNMQRTMGSLEPRTLTIRHNLPGKIMFVETVAEFTIKLNVSVPDDFNSSEIQTNYKLDKDNQSLVLQVFKPESVEVNPPKDQLVLIISTTVSGFVLLCIIFTVTMYCCWWKKRAKRSRDETDDSKEDDTSSSKKKSLKIPTTFSQKRKMFQSGSNPSLHVTIMLVVATVCIVHAQSGTNVDIVVEVPHGFLAPDVRIFINEDNGNVVDATNFTNGSVHVYDVESAYTVQEDKCLQSNKTCVRGICDPLTGECVCPRDKKPVEDNQWGTVCIFKCSHSCPKESFEVSSCNATHEAMCKKCRPPCSFNEFESTACAGQTDRNCTDISQLPEIKVSPHMIYEDLSKVDSDVTASKLITDLSAQYTVWLNRSSGIALRAVIKRADFSTKFRQVTHRNNDNEKFPSNKQMNILKGKFCKSPIPDFYKINLNEFQELDVLKNDLSKLCPNYTTSGTIKPTGKGLYCSGVNNTLVSLFGSRNSSNIFWKTEKDRRCFDTKNACSKCRDSCSNNIQKYPNCNVTEDDVKSKNKHEYGEHFSYCFDCCFSGCTCASCACTTYKNDCVRSQLSCVRVNQYQLLLKPEFPSSGNFKCHVEMSRGPEVVIETSLWRFGRRVYSVSSVDHNLTKENSGRTKHEFGFMSVSHPTVLQSMTDKTVLVSGNTNKNKFKVGIYHHEDDVSNSIATGTARNEIHVQPRVPFSMNSKTWDQSDCNADVDKASGFAVVQDRPIHQNFRQIENLTATLDRQDNEDIYKVFDNKDSHRINFVLSRNLSVMRNMFPKTAIVNDESLVGVLLRNRTFWTLKYSGRLNECPGAFNVKMYDQDMPGVEVYNFDIAVTNISCTFEIEFHLPSGGDTSIIDKQFLTKMTDSYKTVEIILVSPRYKPNFDLPIIVNKPDFDRLLRVLMPAIYALGSAFVLLLALLIYGYKTRPKDDMQRDRDSKLHFRHILFVIWFVGMRLIKSFLLTLTVFFIIFSAIHHQNVNTLKRYSKFRDQRQKIEKEIIKKMDEHKVAELNRQLAHLKAGKKLCDEKLRQVDEMIDAYYAEMRRRLFEEIKVKTIISAAYKKIEKKVKESKAKFDRTRQEVNRRLKAMTNEMNYIIQNIRNKVENNFWLKAAKVLYKIINAFAKIFGSGLGPFIRWVGLDVSFPTVDFNLGSFDSFFDEFLAKFQTPKINFSPNYNFSKVRILAEDLSLKLKELRLPSLNISSPLSNDRAQELLALDWVVAFMRSGVLAGILLVLDVMWFVFRHGRTYQKAVVLLHGVPVVYDLDEIKKEQNKRKSLEADSNRSSHESVTFKEKAISPGDVNNEAEKIEPLNKMEAPALNKESQHKEAASTQDEGCQSSDVEEKSAKETPKSSSKPIKYGMVVLDYLNTGLFYVYGALKRLNYELTKTNLVPMVLLFVMGILLIYVIIVTAKYALTVDTLDTVGYFDVKMSPILVNRKIVNTRITSSAFSINHIQLAYYQKRVNARIEFAKKKAAIFKGFQCTTADHHNKEYCFWVDGKCDGVKGYTEEFLKNLTQLECRVPPVIPQRFTKFDRIIYKEQFKKGIHPFVSASRGLVLNTFYTILIIIAIFLVVQLFGEVVFFALRRFDLIRTVKSYSLQDEIKHKVPDEEETDSPKKKSIKVSRLKIPDTIAKSCGSVRVRSGWHLEYKPEEAKKLRKVKEKEMKKKEKEMKNEKRKSKEDEETDESGKKDGKQKTL